jgi:hypothetical protein
MWVENLDVDSSVAGRVKGRSKKRKHRRREWIYMIMHRPTYNISELTRREEQEKLSLHLFFFFFFYWFLFLKGVET